MLHENLKRIRKSKGLSQGELTASYWRILKEWPLFRLPPTIMKQKQILLSSVFRIIH